MNILVATPYYEPNIVGGAEISTQLMAEGLAMAGHQIYVLTIGKKEEVKIKNKVFVYCIAVGEMYDVWKAVLDGNSQTAKMKLKSAIFSNAVINKYVKKYVRFIKENRIDIAVINSNIECLCRASLWKSFSITHVSVILTLRDPLLLEKKFLGIDIGRIYRDIINKQMKWLTAYAAPSEYMFRLYEDKGFHFSKKRVIYNAVDVKQVYTANKHKRIVYAGGLVEKKGIRTLFSAFDNLKIEGIQLVFIGRGELADEISGHPNVQVLSWMPRQKLYEYMQESWVVVLPSEWPEAFGRVLIEAVYNGTLAIGSSAGGIPEVFGEDNRYVFEEGNMIELRDILYDILQMTSEEYKKEVIKLQKKWTIFSTDNYCIQWNNYINDVYKMMHNKIK